MPHKNNWPEKAAELRKRAEKITKEKTALSTEDIDALLPEETRKILHELRVHQIELEMQNEELRRSQEELDAARARYFDLYDLAPVGYITLSEKGLIIETNLTAATLIGVPRGSLIKQPITQFIHKEDNDTYYRHRKQLFETGEPQECELRVMKQDGTSFWALLAATAAQGADGAPVCRVVVSVINKRKLAEEALRESQERFYTTFMGSPNAVVISTQAEGIWVDVNPVALDMFGYAREEVIGKRALSTNLWVDVDDRKRLTAKLAESGNVSNQEVLLRRKDGSVIIGSVSIRALMLKGVKHLQFVTEDITKRKQAEEALRDSKERLKTLL